MPLAPAGRLLRQVLDSALFLVAANAGRRCLSPIAVRTGIRISSGTQQFSLLATGLESCVFL